jgi:exodeoxyribonuclease X
MTTVLILDTETTRVDNPEVIELAWMAFNGFPSMNVATESAVFRFSPDNPSQYGALAVHGILEEELVGKQPSCDAVLHVPQAEYWIGHNIDFDWKALGQPPVRRIDTMAMARLLLPDLDSHTLAACLYAVAGRSATTRNRLRDAHSAAADIGFCFEIFSWAMSVRNIETIESAWTFSEDARIPRKWTFGKFRGMPISHADRGYANWYRKQPDCDPYVIRACELAGLL